MSKITRDIKTKFWVAYDTNDLLRKVYIKYMSQKRKKGRSWFAQQAINETGTDIGEAECLLPPKIPLYEKCILFLKQEHLDKLRSLEEHYEGKYTIHALMNAILHCHLTDL